MVQTRVLAETGAMQPIGLGDLPELTYGTPPADNFFGTVAPNAVLAGPGTPGSANAAPTFRTEVMADLPAQLQNNPNLAQNMCLLASVASSVLTVTMQNVGGGVPGGGTFQYTGFPSPTLTTGSLSVGSNTATLTLNTVVGGTFGVPANQPYRLWVAWFQNGGTPVLAVYQPFLWSGAGNPTSHYPPTEDIPSACTLIGAGSTVGQTWYGTAAVAAASGNFRIVGYIDVPGQATPGTFTAITAVRTLTAGMKRSGDTIQRKRLNINSALTFTGTTLSFINALLNLAITPAYATSMIKATARGANSNNTTPQAVFQRISRGTISGSGLFGVQSEIQNGVGGGVNNFSIEGWDAPGVTTSTTYTIQGAVSANTGTINTNGEPGEFQLEEIMA